MSVKEQIAQEKRKLLETLAEGIAHEMGTPLSILQGRVEMLRGQYRQGQIEDSLDCIHDQAYRIQRVVETLLQYSSQARVFPESNSSIEDFLAMAENLPLTQLSIENGLKNLRVKISRHHLETILRHLVQNALESYADDDDHRVCMRIERQKKNLLFRIQDFGSGVREEDQIRIFDPFFTTRRRGIGTGMGLSLTQWLVEGYGGKIDFKSAPFEGTVVSIQLPLIK